MTNPHLATPVLQLHHRGPQGRLPCARQGPSRCRAQRREGSLHAAHRGGDGGVCRIDKDGDRSRAGLTGTPALGCPLHLICACRVSLLDPDYACPFALTSDHLLCVVLDCFGKWTTSAHDQQWHGCRNNVSTVSCFSCSSPYYQPGGFSRQHQEIPYTVSLSSLDREKLLARLLFGFLLSWVRY